MLTPLNYLKMLTPLIIFHTSKFMCFCHIIIHCKKCPHRTCWWETKQEGKIVPKNNIILTLGKKLWKLLVPSNAVKYLPAMGQEDPLEEGMATHFSILAWKIPWTEEPGRLWSMVSQQATTTSHYCMKT